MSRTIFIAEYTISLLPTSGHHVQKSLYSFLLSVPLFHFLVFIPDYLIECDKKFHKKAKPHKVSGYSFQYLFHTHLSLLSTSGHHVQRLSFFIQAIDCVEIGRQLMIVVLHIIKKQRLKQHILYTVKPHNLLFLFGKVSIFHPV